MADRYWGLQTNNWNGASGWFSDAGLTTPAADPTSSDDVKFVAGSFTGSGQTLTVNSTAYCKSMDWTGALNSPAFSVASGQVIYCYGDAEFISSMSWIYTSSTSNFTMVRSGTFTTNGLAIKVGQLNLSSGTGCTVSLADDLLHNGTFAACYVSDGTLNTNNHNITTGTFYSAYASGTRVINLGSSLISLSIGLNMATLAQGLTINAGTSTINVSGTGGFSGGGQAYNIVNLNGSAHTVSGDNTIARVGLNPAGAQTITWTDGSNNTIGKMARTGSGVIIFKGSGVAGWTLASVGSVVCSLYNMSISRGIATARRFFAGTNSTDGGNNVGWLFYNKPQSYWRKSKSMELLYKDLGLSL